MRIRHLRLRISTDMGLHGTDIPFPDGLVVLWADNSMGKSTCLRAILVALGMEAMLTTKKSDIPLPQVMKAELESSNGIARVLQSDIYLEIENKAGARIAVHRTVKGTRSRDLITVSQGPALTRSEDSYPTRDYFVSRPGAAARESGFHHFLAKFLGWDLPIVRTFEDREYSLYLQCVFPYLVVEQKRGWANIDPPLPSQFRIREVHKRVLEFLLDLDAIRIARKRGEILEQERNLKFRWAKVVSDLKIIAQTSGGRPNALPESPIAAWPPEIFPTIVLPHLEEWVPASKLIDALSKELRELTEREIPRVSEIARDGDAQLAERQRNLRRLELTTERILESLELERGEVENIEERLKQIEEDLQRNKDARTLVNLGSEFAPQVAEGVCPSCHQSIVDTLAPLAEGQSVMSIDENIKFLENQRATFRAALQNSRSIVTAREDQIAQIRAKLQQDRAAIRALKETLVSDSRLPSKMAIQRQMELQQRIKSLQQTLERFSERLNELEDLSEKWTQIQTNIKNLPRLDASDKDREKVRRWSERFQEQLGKYDFKSLEIDSISISEESYRPIHEGFDLPSNVSASDFIRVIWAYLTGLLELSRDFKINHPGLLILDEPKQQSAKDLSFESLLSRASQAKQNGEQIIFATSEDRPTLRRMLSEISHEYIEFEGRVIGNISP